MAQRAHAGSPATIPLEPVAEFFLRMDTIRTVGNGGTLFVFDASRADPAALTAAALRELIASRLDSLPILRRRLVTLAGGEGRHGWVEEESPPLDELVLDHDLGSKAGIRELSAEVSRLNARPLARSRQLWLMHVIRLGEGRVAVLFRHHHSLGDAAVTRRMKDVLFAAGPAPPEPPGAPRRAIEPSTPAAELQPSPATRFNRRLCGERDLVFASVATPRLLRIKDAAGLTFAGALSAAVAGGLRAWLAARDEAPEAPLICQVPASTRRPGDSAEAGNRLAVLWVPLPAHEPDRASRIGLVRDGLAAAKHRAIQGRAAGPPGGRMTLSLSAFVNTPRPLEWLGAPLEANYGYGLMPPAGLSITSSSRPDLTCLSAQVDRQQGEGGWSILEALLEEVDALQRHLA